jgi:hypothetical protein
VHQSQEKRHEVKRRQRTERNKLGDKRKKLPQKACKTSNAIASKAVFWLGQALTNTPSLKTLELQSRKAIPSLFERILTS